MHLTIPLSPPIRRIQLIYLDRSRFRGWRITQIGSQPDADSPSSVALPVGRWAFRQRVPADLQGIPGCRPLKRSLRTADLPEARLRAVLLAAGYARLFSLLRDQRVAKLSKDEADALIARLSGADNLRDLTLVTFLGEKARVASITRSDLARWYQAMRKAGGSTPTLTNKQSYVGGKGGFFDWAMASATTPKATTRPAAMSATRPRRSGRGGSRDSKPLIATSFRPCLRPLPSRSFPSRLNGPRSSASTPAPERPK